MALRDFTKLKHVFDIGDSLLMNELEANLKSYLDWSFLGVGGWFDVTIPTSGAYGGDFATLRAVSDPSYTDGQVWETARKDLVWETGVEESGGNEPIDISGVWVDSTFYDRTDATYGHSINHHLGRVVFDTAIATTSTVQLNHSYRQIQVYRADDAPWWTELQYNSFRVDSEHFTQSASGDWDMLGNHRVQMPAIVIETVPRGISRPFELGNSSLWVEQDVLFHILAESRFDRNNIIDYIRLQHDKNIWLFNSNNITNASDWPLDSDGDKVSSPKMYPDYVTDYRWKKCKFKRASVSEVQSLNPHLHEGTVRITFELVFGDV